MVLDNPSWSARAQLDIRIVSPIRCGHGYASLFWIQSRSRDLDYRRESSPWS